MTVLDARALAALFPVPVAVSAGTCELVDDRLFPEERHHVRRAVASRRAEFGSARVRAREALARLGGPHVALVPHPDRSPAWPDGFIGSLTHSSTRCAAVVARTGVARALGLDIEPAGPLDAALLATVCTPAERHAVEALPTGRGLELAKWLFSAKEAFYKCQYPLTGTFLSCAQVELRLDVEAGTFAVVAVDLPGEDERAVRGMYGRCATLEGHVVSAAVLVSGASQGR